MKTIILNTDGSVANVINGAHPESFIQHTTHEVVEDDFYVGPGMNKNPDGSFSYPEKQTEE